MPSKVIVVLICYGRKIDRANLFFVTLLIIFNKRACPLANARLTRLVIG